MNVWTEEDERNLLAMQQRKKETIDAATNALASVVRAHVKIQATRAELLDAMIAHGGEFRDALAPFDHMGRATPEPKAPPSMWDGGNPPALAAPTYMWTPHKPGPMPVASTTIVAVRCADGTGVEKIGTAGSFLWHEASDPNNTIVAYRVVCQ